MSYSPESPAGPRSSAHTGPNSSPRTGPQDRAGSTPPRTSGSPGGGLHLSGWEIGFLVSVLVVLVGSIIPLATARWGMNLWGTANVFFLGIGVLMPLAAAGFVVARAASSGSSSGEGPRLGSLSTAQFAHVASWLALAYFFVTFATGLDPVLLIGLVGALGMVVTSPLRGVVAPLLDSVNSGESRQQSRQSQQPQQHEQRGQAPSAADGHPFGAYPGPTAAPAAPADGSAEGPAKGPVPAPAAPDAALFGDPATLSAAPTDDEHEEFRAGPSGEEQEGQNVSEHGSDRSSESSSDRSASQTSGADIDEDLGMTRLHPRSTDEAAASATAAFGAPGTQPVENAEDPQSTKSPQNTDRSVSPEPAQYTEAMEQTVPAQTIPLNDARSAGYAEPAGNAGSASAVGNAGSAGTAGAASGSAAPMEYEAFWFAVGTRRTAVNPEDGSPAFTLEPGGWILALEDRGHEFLVQNTDGRTGVLRDLTDIERA
ncbi:hypothetical protein [Citricoccus sp. GCM10030269]|uniref:hypothetical protein n=1 Tax=Citricoccus sp. GCM10030269 TaxID=3273388 RepID=UPI00361F2EE0